MDMESVICFETHVELSTRTKLFCGCSTLPGTRPNTRICPVCTGQPGALPVLNRTAVAYAVRAGLALKAAVNRKSRFARKNYFYPDLPKGYQISQYERPFCENGTLEIIGDDGRPYPVGIRRIHLEEDAGKLLHSADAFQASDYSLVDYNRSGVPLLEIVGDHEKNPLRSIREARSYLEKLRQILQYIGISDCIIERGQFRCDVNVSLRPAGSQSFGNRTEIKNMASFRAVMEALEFEIERQSELLRAGREVAQQTRLFDEARKVTVPMRSKEDAPDYRYFPDPDLVEVELDAAFVEEAGKEIPELPDQSVHSLIEAFGIPRSDALILTQDRNVSEYFRRSAAACRNPKTLSRWIIKDLFRLLKEAPVSIDACPVEPTSLAELVNLIDQGEITAKIARIVLEEMFRSGGTPEGIVRKRGLKPVTDARVLEKILDEVLAGNPQAVAQIRDGDTKPISFLIGQVMKRTQGKADPGRLHELLRKKISL